MKKTLDQLYALIPSAPCKAGCVRCCGPVPFSPEEKEKIAMPWRFDGLFSKYDENSLTCTFAMGGKCEIYENRPLICRIFGATPCFWCPEFENDPQKQLTEHQTMEIMFSYFELFPDPEELFNPTHVELLRQHDVKVGLRKQ